MADDTAPADTGTEAVEALLSRVRDLCLTLPEVTEKLSHGSPSFFARKMFLTWVDDHHGDGNIGFWCAAPPGAQSELVADDPARYFVPPYVGGRGWVGVRLVPKVSSTGPAAETGAETQETQNRPAPTDPAWTKPDWREVEDLIEDAYRTVAPPTLLRSLEQREKS